LKSNNILQDELVVISQKVSEHIEPLRKQLEPLGIELQVLIFPVEQKARVEEVLQQLREEFN
jgi:hypothetical protein